MEWFWDRFQEDVDQAKEKVDGLKWVSDQEKETFRAELDSFVSKASESWDTLENTVENVLNIIKSSWEWMKEFIQMLHVYEFWIENIIWMSEWQDKIADTKEEKNELNQRIESLYKEYGKNQKDETVVAALWEAYYDAWKSNLNGQWAKLWVEAINFLQWYNKLDTWRDNSRVNSMLADLMDAKWDKKYADWYRKKVAWDWRKEKQEMWNKWMEQWSKEKLEKMQEDYEKAKQQPLDSQVTQLSDAISKWDHDKISMFSNAIEQTMSNEWKMKEFASRFSSENQLKDYLQSLKPLFEKTEKWVDLLALLDKCVDKLLPYLKVNFPEIEIWEKHNLIEKTKRWVKWLKPKIVWKNQKKN